MNEPLVLFVSIFAGTLLANALTEIFKAYQSMKIHNKVMGDIFSLTKTQSEKRTRDVEKLTNLVMKVEQPSFKDKQRRKKRTERSLEQNERPVEQLPRHRGRKRKFNPEK